MKKFLSLVLALVMTMSLVTISAGAEDFTDAADITYEEAVDVVSAAGIVSGYENGAFNPEGKLTRGAAAKIICNMILGPTTAGALSANDAPYKDVPVDHTFAGYIAYCANEGIISGYADGTFRPAAPLTGYAFMKMLLGALGYDASIEGYTGSNWSIQVAKRALNIGLDKGLEGDFAGTDTLTREEACLYAFNTLKADMVQYASKSKITVGDIVITEDCDAEKITYDADAENIWKESDDQKVPTLQFAEKYFDDLSIVKSKDEDNFGRPATTWKWDKDEIGTYVSEDPILVYVADFDAAELKDLKKEYDFTAETIKVNGQANCAGLTTVEELAAREYTGTVIELYDVNEDDDIELIVVVQGYFAQIDKEEEDYISVDIYDPWATPVKASVTYTDNTKKDTDTFDKLSAAYDEDDYFMIFTEAADPDDGEVIDFCDVESVTGEIDTTKLDVANNGYVTTTAGEKFEMASGYMDNADLKVGEEYTLFFDENDFVIGAEKVKEGVSIIEDIYYVDSVWSKSSIVAGDSVVTHYAQLVAMDGTVKEIVLEKADKNAETKNGTALYTYVDGWDATPVDNDYIGELVKISDKKWTDLNGKTHKGADEKFDLTVWTDYGTDDDEWDVYFDDFTTDIEKDSKRVSGSKTYRLNDETKYIFIEKDGADLDVDIYTGAVAFEAADVDSAIIITEHESMVASYVIINTTDSDQAQTYSDDAIFIVKNSTEKGDGYRIQEVIYADGTKGTLKVDESEYGTLFGFYTYDTNTDGFIVLENATDMALSANIVWEDEEGAIESASIAKNALFDDLLTVTGSKKVEDIDVANAAFVDAHDDEASGQYDKTVSSLEALCDLIDDDKIMNVVINLNVADDGAVLIVVTSIAPYSAPLS